MWKLRTYLMAKPNNPLLQVYRLAFSTRSVVIDVLVLFDTVHHHLRLGLEIGPVKGGRMGDLRKGIVQLRLFVRDCSLSQPMTSIISPWKAIIRVIVRGVSGPKAPKGISLDWTSDILLLVHKRGILAVVFLVVVCHGHVGLRNRLLACSKAALRAPRRRRLTCCCSLAMVSLSNMGTHR